MIRPRQFRCLRHVIGLDVTHGLRRHRWVGHRLFLVPGAQAECEVPAGLGPKQRVIGVENVLHADHQLAHNFLERLHLGAQKRTRTSTPLRVLRPENKTWASTPATAHSYFTQVFDLVEDHFSPVLLVLRHSTRFLFEKDNVETTADGLHAGAVST